MAFDAPYTIRDDDVREAPSPSLIIFRPLVRANLEAMIKLAGSPDRLRPHMKTHKMPDAIRMAEGLGIRKHKAATIAEAEMAARVGAGDVLLAFPLVGPNVGRFVELVRSYPDTTFRALADDADAARALSDAAAAAGIRVPTLLDLDVGMGRTGVLPGSKAEAVYEAIASAPGLIADGIHAYDGHTREVDPEARARFVRETVHQPTFALRERLIARGLPVPRLIFGGTPSFPIHARLGAERDDVESSPGTCVLHDIGYGRTFPDLPFTPAALLLTRVVSRPREGFLTLDVGHKAVAADPVGKRLVLIGLEDAEPVGHSEEHYVVRTDRASEFPPGTPFLAIPVHICPTCALHQRALVVDDGRIVGEWPIPARDRFLAPMARG